jgi:predicted RNase H-like nuclease (RuvC/YqgF family)
MKIKFVYILGLMSEFKEKIEQLSIKVEKLIHLHTRYKAEISHLKSDNEKLISELELKEKKINELSEKNKVIKIAKSLAETGENAHDIKLKLNEVLREVDRCIALLNK